MKLLSILCLSLLHVHIVFAGNKAKVLKANNIASVSISTGKNLRSYLPVHFAKSTQLNIHGPGVLKIITRSEALKKSTNYTFAYALNNTTLKTITYKKQGVSKAKVNTQRLTQSETFEIEIPEGINSFELKSLKKGQTVYARCLFTPTKKKAYKWISLSPHSENEQHNIVVNEHITPYYAFTSEKPLEAEVIGPVKIRLLTRIGHQFNMRGRVLYRVQVKLDDTLISAYQLHSKRSQTAQFETKGTKVPGKAKEIVLDIPEGKHRLSISPANHELIGRFMIPKSAIIQFSHL